MIRPRITVILLIACVELAIPKGVFGMTDSVSHSAKGPQLLQKNTKRLVLVSCTPIPSWGIASATMEQAIMNLINAHRESIGLKALSYSPELASAARWKSMHMAGYNYMNHDDPSPPIARPWSTRISDCGYNGRGAGENIASGYPDANSVLGGWLGSPGHKANIEDPTYVTTGVGAVRSAAGTMYWTQDFGMSPDPTPVPPDPKDAAITEIQAGLNNMVTTMHYSVAKVQKTHFYKALIALGGSWNGPK